MKHIALTKTLEDYCEARETALSDYRGILAAYDRIKLNLSMVGPYVMPSSYRHDLMSLEDFTRDLDRNMWRRAYNQTGLAQFFDSKAKAEFESSIEKDPPPFTMENARSALLSSAADADMMFARGVVELFLNLSHIYATNRDKAFEIGRKFILDGMVEPGFGSHRGLQFKILYRRFEMNDLDRVIKIIDGEKFNPGELKSAIEHAFQKSSIYEDDYYRIKGFKKGTMHIELKREDLRIKINQIISAYYDGRALATAA